MPSEKYVAFNLDTLVEQLKSAAINPDPRKSIRTIMDDAFADPDQVMRSMPKFDDNDVILFEDEMISIWHCRFDPGISVPAHDHQMSAFIGVYTGLEKNIFYKAASDNSIQVSKSVVMKPGDVLAIGPNAIHSVTCDSNTPSCGIHVYLGELTKIDRSLFDVENNQQIPFTDKHYKKLTYDIC